MGESAMAFGPASPTFARFKRKLTVHVRNFDDFTAMADLFEGIQELPNPVPGCPNFRRVPSYRVFCCGQPTVEGFQAALDKVCGDAYPKDGKIIWVNTRQEPCVYVNGEPIRARPPDKIGKYADFTNVTTASVLRDEKETEVKSLVSCGDIMEDIKKKYTGLVYLRLPMQHGAAPKEADFDTFLSTLIGTGFNTPVIINDHIGDNRATTGGILACIFKEFQVSASYDGLVASIPGVDQSVLNMCKYKEDSKKDPMTKGEFNVIKKLMANLDGVASAKKEMDKIIDVNGTKATGGTGMVQIREDIASNKMKFELVDDAEQAVLKNKIIDNIQKYFYLIVFTVYMRTEI